MKIFCFTLLLSLTFIFCHTQTQKTVGDCTATFSISSNQAATNSNLSGAVKTLYINSKTAATKA